MLEMIRSLVAHQEWADTELLEAVNRFDAARDDAQLRATLHHIAVVQRAFLSFFLERAFDVQGESAAAATYAGLTQLYEVTHREQREFLAHVPESGLNREVPLPWKEGFNPSLAEAWMQVVMHSQNHRGQCLTGLRELGAKPPTLDYIFWLKRQRSQS